MISSKHLRQMLLLLLVGAPTPAVVFAQRSRNRSSSRDAAPGGASWRLAGRVTTPHGDGVAGADIEVTLEGARRPAAMLETGIRGDFQTAIPAHVGDSRTQVAIRASRAGLVDAQDTIELEAGRQAAPVELVLQKEPPDPQLPAWDSLIAALAPRMREPSTGAALTGIQLKHFELALRMLDDGDNAEAAPVFAGVARHDPACVECLTLASLAGLASGAWSTAAGRINQAARLAALAQGKGRRMEPFVVLGALQTLKGEFAKAQISLLQALALKPDDPLALLELGRAFLLLGKVPTADRYLTRALAHGATRDAHLLRAQALGELGHPEESRDQLDAYLDGRKPKQLAAGPRALYTELTERIELAEGGVAYSVIDRNPAELAKTVPELNSLKPDDDQSDLEPTLQKVGDNVQLLFETLPDTSSHEEVEMERLRPDGKRAGALDQEFEYLAINGRNDDGLQLNEYRTDKSGRAATPGDEEGNFMITKGFAADPLIFYPGWQEGSTFRLIGRQQLDGHDAIVIAFAERPAKAKMLEDFRIKGQSAVVLVQGFAWVDAASYKVLRMRTELLKPAPAVRLDAQTTDVRFNEVRFNAKDDSFWLPQEVSVLVRWNGKIFHNWHHYTDYAIFQVNTHQKIKSPKTPATGSGVDDKPSHSGSGTD